MQVFDTFLEEITALRRKQLFFVHGSMKSGTTWLQLMLDAHPSVSCRGEGHFADYLTPILMEAIKGYNAVIEEKNRDIFNEIDGFPTLSTEHSGHLVATSILLLMAEYSRNKNAIAVGEKTPNSIVFLPVLGSLFPNAKFIHIVRDGRDCAISAWFHNLRTNAKWVHEAFPTQEAFIETFAGMWAYENNKAAEFAESYPQHCMTVRYEDLLENPQQMLGDILRFLGIQATTEELTACREVTSFEALSKGRQQGEENRTSFFRKGIRGDWRNHFTPEMADTFREKAGTWLDRYGYGDPLACQCI